MKFNSFWERYFAGVRWTELLLAVVAAFIGALQAETATGQKVDRETLIKAAGVGLSVAWAYLRMPKQDAGDSSALSGSFEGEAGELPPGVDATGPEHDITEELAIKVVNNVLGPVAAAAPDLAKNVVGELKRVLRRGIRL